MLRSLEATILDAFGLDIDAAEPAISRECISAADVRRWMMSDELDALAALHYLVVDKNGAAIVAPRLSSDEINEFSKRYYERCLLEDRREPGNWSATRYSAAWSIVNWFARVWRNADAKRRWPAEIKRWLAAMFLAGDEALRTCLITGTLEHLFEDRQIARFFSDWEQHGILGDAYRAAIEWSEKGGTSPLGEPRPK